MAQTPATFVRQASRWSTLWGILLIILGILAVSSPLIAAVAVTIVLSWVIIVAGVVHLITAFHSERAVGLFWRTLVGLAYIFFGIYLLSHPTLGVLSLTFVLATLLVIAGVFDIVQFFQVRSVARSGWILFDGIVSVLLGLLIYAHWPSSSLWALGTLVGVGMIVSGITRVMLALTVRRIVDESDTHTRMAA